MNRRALVTGATSGIGEAVARLLAEEGYRVALLARRVTELERVAGALPNHGGEHLVVPCDLCDAPAIDAAFEQVGATFGGLELLVNNAGVGYRARVEELEADLVHRVFDTNVVGMLLTCRAALPLLRRGDRPVAINVSSVVGRRGIPGQSVYSASKAAVCSIGEALRIEWAEEGIEVCTLAPALTTTGFFEAQANPSNLEDPDFSSAAGPLDVARHVLQLDREPEPERYLRTKWRWLGALTVVAPRLADALLVRRLGGGWSRPRRFGGR